MERLDLQKAVFRASLEFTEAIGAKIMVYHGGTTKPGDEKAGLSVEQLKEVEREALSELADEAAALGIVIGVENARTTCTCLPVGARYRIERLSISW